MASAKKITLVLSSFNQKKRLRLCLHSALNQKLNTVTDYQIVVADDNSTDGTIEMLTDPKGEFFGRINISLSTKSEVKKYTLADNWNEAVSQCARGDRLVFSNGDVMFVAGFIEAHVDPIMQDHIIIGPVMRTTPHVLPLIEGDSSYKDIVQFAANSGLLYPDMRMGLIAHTYNKEEPPWHVYGYNFSCTREHFDGVGGFPPYKQYGGEDTQIGKNILAKYNCKVLTNKNALGIHLWHPQVNSIGKTDREDYSF